MQTRIGSRYLQRYITKTASVTISGITRVSEIARMVRQCLRSVIQMAQKMTEREQFYYGKGYAKGRIDLLIEINEELKEIDDNYSNEYKAGVNRVIYILNKVAGVKDGKK
jgi:hypothetical protein